ncbi:MAG: hypothetical protein RMA76_24715 [Deltaproteobacteria bacterium]|jgi:hypothetical protein
MKTIQAVDTQEVLENAKTMGSNALDTVKDASVRAKDYAVEHKAITMVGAVAVAAMAFGAFALFKKKQDA